MKTLKSARFTLLETLAAVGIALVLMGLAFSLIGFRGKASESSSKSLVKTVAMALESYKAAFGYYPQALSASCFYLDVVDPSGAIESQRIDRNFCGFINYELFKAKFAKEAGGSLWLSDSFGNSLVYRCPGLFNRNGFDLGSLGPDGRYGLGGRAFNAADPETALDGYKDKFGTGDDFANFER